MQMRVAALASSKFGSLVGVALAGALIFATLMPGTKALADDLPALPAPSLGAASPSDASFCAPLLNFDSDSTYSFSTEGSDTAAGFLWGYNNQHFVCANDVYSGEQVVLHITVSKVGFTSSSATITGVSLLTPPEISYTNYTRTVDGFIVEFSPEAALDETRQLYTYAGEIEFLDSAHLKVSGLTAGQSTECGIIVTRPGYYSASWAFNGAALDSPEPTVDPTPEPVTPSSPSVDSTDSADSADSIDDTAAQAAEATRQAVLHAAVAAHILEKETLKAKQLEVLKEAEAAKLAADKAVIAPIVARPGSVTTASIRSITSDQISLVPVAAFRSLPEKVIAGLQAKQAAGLTAAQVRSLTIAKLKKLSPSAIGELKPDTFAALSVAKLRALSKAQVKAIWAAQILQLDPDQRKAIKR